MSLSSPSVPTVPDPNVVAANQQQLNQSAMVTGQAASNVNQVNPYGSLTYAQTGTGPNGVPTYTATEQLTPAQQQLLNTMQGTQQTAGTQAGKLLSGANYGATNPATTIGNSTSGETQALLGQETSYLNPYFTNQTTQLQTKLANQGIYPGSPAYAQQMMDLQGNQNQAVTGFLASAEPAAYQQAVQSYELPGQMAESLAGFATPGSVNSNLTSTPGASMQPANLVGAVSAADQANMQAYQAQLSQQNAMMSGLFGLGGAAINGGSGGFGNSLLGGLIGSDRRIKQHVEIVGTLFDGTPVYRFQYIEGPPAWHIGVMAQDVEVFEPGAVHDIGGIKYVDYFKATQRAADHGRH